MLESTERPTPVNLAFPTTEEITDIVVRHFSTANWERQELARSEFVQPRNGGFSGTRSVYGEAA